MSTAKRWAAVLAIALGTFVLVTNEFLPVGLLPQIAHGLAVSPVVAGTMVTAPAIVASIAAPALTMAAGRLDRKLFLIGMMVTFTTADLLGAVAPTFPIMLIARIILGAGIGGFWAIGGTLGARLVGAASGRRATAIIFGGISTATVIGVPAGVALGVAAGWRTAFAATAGLAVVTLVLLVMLLPRLGADAPVRLATLTRLLRVPAARLGLLATVLLVTGHFLGYTFISPFLLGSAGLTQRALTIALFVFGATGLAGNFLVAPLSRRHLYASIVVAAALVTIPAAVLAFSGGSGSPIVLVGLWGLGYGAVPVALQTWIGRAAATEFESGSSLYIASFQGSIAAGSLLGGLAVDLGSTSIALAAGAVLALVAITVFILGSRRALGRTTDHVSVAVPEVPAAVMKEKQPCP